MSDTSLVFNLIGKDRGVSSMLAKTSGQVKAANVASAASTVALGTAMASTSAYAVALASAVSQVVGVGLLLPSVGFAAAAGFGVAKVATMNLGAALKTSAGAAGGASRSADLLEAAEHRVAQSQRAALDAQTGLNEARADAKERIEDLTRSLTGAKISEERATRAVADAEKALRQARASGSVDKIAEADLAYRESLNTLDEAKDRTEDLGQEQADAAAKGVEGSDLVQQALRRQTDAVYELAQAQKALNQARSGGGGGGRDPQAEAMAKLAPSARDLVTTIKALTPAWQGAGRAIQEQVWKGVSGDIRGLSSVYLPMMTSRLSGVGAAFNRALRESAGLAKTKGFSDDVDTSLGNVVTTSDRLARAVRPVLNGFMQLVVVGSSFLPGIAGSTLTIAERFERWAISARESGKLKQWIGDALGVLGQLGAIGVNVLGIVTAILKGGGADEGKDLLQKLEDGTKKMKEFLGSAEGQEKIQKVLGTLRGIIDAVVAGLTDLSTEGTSSNDTFKVTGFVMGLVAGNLDTIAANLPLVIAGFAAYKASQVAANIASVVSLPITALHSAALFTNAMANRTLAAAIKGSTLSTATNTATTAANTGVTNVGMLTRIRSTVATVASTVATTAANIATKAWAAGQWLLNAAMSMNPIGLVIIAIVALVAIFIYAWNHSETFRKIVIGAWEGIKIAAEFVWHWMTDTLWPGIVAVWNGIKDGAGAAVQWVVDKFNWWIDLMTGIRARIAGALGGLWDTFLAMTKGAINTVIGLWNRLDFGIHLRVPDWVPGIGGQGFDINDVIPDIPMLESGGTITRGGAAIVADRNGQGGEVVSLPSGAQVTPLGRGGGQGGRQALELRFAPGSDPALVALFRRLIREANLLQEA